MEEVKVVSLTDVIGTCGKYQIVMYLLSFYSSWFLGTTIVTVELLAPMVTMYWNWDASNPNKTTFSSVDCKMATIMELNRTSSFSNSSSKLVYESHYSKRTLTEELGMVCEHSWYVSLANLLSILGLCAGNLCLRLTEKYGRRPFIFVAGVGSAVFSIFMCFTKQYITFAICNFLYRSFTHQAYLLLFIQAVELTPQTHSPYIGLFTKSGLLFAQTIFVGAAWILQNWFYTQLFQAFLAVWYLLLVWYALESPIWLAVRGRYKESREVLEKILKRNGRNVQEAESKINAWLEHMKVRCEIQSKAEKGKFTDLFKNKLMSLYTLGLVCTSFSAIFIFSGLVMNTESFGSGLYFDLTVSNAFSFLPVIAAGFLLKRVSIRVMLSVSYVCEGISCLAYPIAYGSTLGRTIISVLGRIFIAPAASVGFLYVNDLLPTSVRGVGTGVIGVITFTLSTSAPFTKELGERTAMYVPFLLFGFISLGCALVFKLLPETKGRPMIHTVDELTKFRKKSTRTSVYTITTKL